MLLPKLGGSRLLPPWDFPHLYVRVTLWTTTAFHLDTPNYQSLARLSALAVETLAAKDGKTNRPRLNWPCSEAKQGCLSPIHPAVHWVPGAGRSIVMPRPACLASS